MSTMSTIQVLHDSDENGFKVMIDYIKRGTTLHSKELANQEADKLALREGIAKVCHIK